MKRIYSLSKFILPILFFSFTLTNCGGGGGGSNDGGGGGGGGQSSITYSGVTTQASINSTNADDLTSGALFGGLFGSSIVSLAAAENNNKFKISHFYLVDLPKILLRSAENVNWLPGQKISLNRVESNAVNGDCGGALNYTITVDDTTGNFNGIYTYSQYCDGGITISGEASVDGSIDLATDGIKIINYKFDNLEVDEDIISGEISLDTTNSNLLLTTLDIFYKDIVENKVYWFDNYSTTMALINNADFELVITGVFYHPDYGYLNVSTQNPFIFLSTDSFPSIGAILCDGSGNTKSTFTAIDNQSFKIDADTNGDGVYDYTSGALLWANF